MLTCAAGKLSAMSFMETVEKTEFEKVKKLIARIFPSAYLDTWDLIPESIHQFAATGGIVLKWKKMDNWADFEIGEIDFEEIEFLDYAFYVHKPTGPIYVVTDQCKARKAYRMASDQLLKFVRSIDRIDVKFLFPNRWIMSSSTQINTL
jgi:hypothetical protein